MTVTILMPAYGDGTAGRQVNVTDPSTAASLFAQGGAVLTGNGQLVTPTPISGNTTDPDGWMIFGETLTAYFGGTPPPAGVTPAQNFLNGVVTSALNSGVYVLPNTPVTPPPNPLFPGAAASTPTVAPAATGSAMGISSLASYLTLENLAIAGVVLFLVARWL